MAGVASALRFDPAFEAGQGRGRGRCDVDEVRMYRGLRTEEVVHLTHRYADATLRPYPQRYARPRNRGPRVNLAIIELPNVRGASLPRSLRPAG